MATVKNPLTRIFRDPSWLTALFFIAAAGLLTYANALPNSFHFDDIPGIVRNPALRDLSNIPSYFTDPATFGLGRTREWRPILQITYALNYAIAGLNPSVFRSFNLLFHAGTAFLIYLIVSRIGGLWPQTLSADETATGNLAALGCALLFAVHTANSEAVDYIWARSSLLATFFCLLAFYCYLRGPFSREERPPRYWHLAALFSFALGVGTKATAISLPALLLLYEYLFLNRTAANPFKLFLTEPRRFKKYIPALMIAFAYLAIRLLLLPRMFTNVAVASGVREVSSYSYLLTQFRAWIYYIRLFLWPHPLIMDYSSFGWSRSLSDPRVLVSLVLLAAILIAGWIARKNKPLLTLFILWYFIALLPEASVIPLADAVVGYRAYPAYVALAVVFVMSSIHGAAFFGRLLATPNGQSHSRFGFGCGLMVGLIFLSLTLATVIRNRDWRDEKSLWTDVLKKDPLNPRPHMSLGSDALIRGDYRQAQAFFDRAIELAASNSHAYILRGYLNSRLDRNEQALSDYAMSIQLDKRSPYGFFYRAELYRKLEQPDKALADYEAALTFMPYYTDAYLGAAMAYLDKDNIAGATQACAKLLDIDGEDRRGYDCLGTLLIEQGRLADAVHLYERAVERVAGDRELWQSLAEAYEKQGMSKEAAMALAKAKEIASRPRRPPSAAIPGVQ